MRRALTVTVTALVLLVLALVYPKVVESEGFQSEVPGTDVTITHFIIYAPLNKIIDKLPFVHSNFSNVSKYDVATLAATDGKLVDIPTTTTPAPHQSLKNLVNGDADGAVTRLWAFELKNAIVGKLEQSNIDALNDASKQLFDGEENKIAFKTWTGRLFPFIKV